MNNLVDIQSQIQKLQKQAEDIRAKEFDKTVQETRKDGGLRHRRSGLASVFDKSQRSSQTTPPKKSSALRASAGVAWPWPPSTRVPMEKLGLGVG